MSNDRLWLTCKTCGEMRLLAKYWGYDWPEFDQEEPLDEWLTRHTHGDPRPPHDDIPRFTAFTEGDKPLSKCIDVGDDHPSKKKRIWYAKKEKLQ